MSALADLQMRNQQMAIAKAKEAERKNKVYESQSTDDSRVRGLLRYYDKNNDSTAVGDALGNPEFQKMRGFAFSNAEDPVFAAQRASAGTAAESQRGRTRADALEALQRQEQSLGGQQANAYSQLAMGGGLSSGARERIASGGMQTNLLAKQGLRAEEQRGLTSIGTAEQGALGELGVAEAKARQDAQGRVTAALAAEEDRKIKAREERRRTALEGEAALLKAKRETGIAEANKDEGSWLCDAVRDSIGGYTDSVKMGLVALREFAADDDPESYHLYMERFPMVIKAMQLRGEDFSRHAPFVKRVAEMANEDPVQAFEEYKEKATELISNFYPQFFLKGVH